MTITAELPGFDIRIVFSRTAAITFAKEGGWWAVQDATTVRRTDEEIRASVEILKDHGWSVVRVVR